MDYEKKYNEALSQARFYYGNCPTEPEKKKLEKLFPELREDDDDERAAKAIDEIMKLSRAWEIAAKYGLTAGDIRKWLKKQKEQKPVECSEVELEFRGEKVTVKRPFYRDDKGRGYSTAELDEGVAWNALRAWCEKKGISLYDLYPKAEWGEEDERIVGRIQMILEFFDRNYPADMNIGSEVPKYISWLKSLRPSWKPSEEQMDSLRDTIVQTKGYSYSMYLPELYEQLKKL